MKISFYEFCIESGREYLLKEWHSSKNKTLTPYNTAKTSRKIVWWKCGRGHEWQTQAASRLSGTGCPKCYSLKLKEKRKIKNKRQNLHSLPNHKTNGV